MTVSQEKLLAVLREKVEAIDEYTRVKGYKKSVFLSLAEIVVLERQHRQSAIQIQKRVSDQCQALGRILSDTEWTPK